VIPGLRVGHVTDAAGLTGCTVILSDTPAVGGVEIRGWAAGVHGLEFLDPRHLVPTLDGVVLAGGSADWLLLRADGVLEMDLRVTLRTDDGALISMKSFGLRHGPPEVMAAIGRGETVDPAAYYFRTTPRFETAQPAYAFLNSLVAVATGDRRPEGPTYTVYEVL